jgi:hypothetical protein
VIRRGGRGVVVSKLIEYVCPSPTRHQSAGSVRRSTARQIVSKLIEFVCPSPTRHRSAGSVRRLTARQIVSKLIEFVCPPPTRHRSAGSVRRSTAYLAGDEDLTHSPSIRSVVCGRYRRILFVVSFILQRNFIFRHPCTM